MAHEIDQTTSRQGSAMFAYQPAWHGLGTVVSEAQTSAAALKIAGLDWTVATTDLCADFGEAAGDQRYRLVPDSRATYRMDTGRPLGAVGRMYLPLQNHEAFAWMDDIVGESRAIWHTCGSLRGGRKVWMLAKLPGSLEVTDRDVLEKYVLIVNPHDGSGALRLFPTSVRVVCANTLRLAMGEASLGIRLFHTASGLAKRTEAAREMLGIVDKGHEQFAEQARAMKEKGLSSRGVAEYFGGLAEGRTDKGRERLLTSLWDRFALPTNADGFGANVWTAYNAASEYADHEMRVVGSSQQRVERRFNSAIFGTADAFKKSAWQGAVKLMAV